MNEESRPTTVLMDVMLHGWFDNGSTTLRSHVSQHRLVRGGAKELWVPQTEVYWQRDAEVFAGPDVERTLAAGVVKALTRYCEAMKLGDFAD